MLSLGDVEGMRVWRRIIDAIGELRRQVPAAEEKVH